MRVSKAILQRNLLALKRFDPAGSPYIGLQLEAEAELPLLHRSSAVGYIQSLGYREDVSPLVVSLAHLNFTLANGTIAESVDLSMDGEGALTVTGTNELDIDELCVYTIRPNVAWSQLHDTGEESVEISPEGFKGINTTCFDLCVPPVLRRARLMLATHQGVIFRNEVPVEAYPYPREAFLRVLSTLPVERVFLTRNGYWGAIVGGMRLLMAGHRVGNETFDLYSMGATQVAKMSANRLLTVLKSASDAAAEGRRISVQPTRLQVLTPYGKTNTWSLSEAGEWDGFAINPPTARLIHDALAQSQDETLSLQRVDDVLMRLKRGLWEVTFKTFNIEKRG